MWLTLLHGPDRDSTTERGVQAWLEQSDLNKEAFEHVTSVWTRHRMLVRRAAGVKVLVPGEEEQPARLWLRVSMAGAVVAALAIIVGGAHYFSQSRGIATGVGEQRSVVLEDGTRVVLNTSTHIVMDYSGASRRVTLEAGEALFTVVKQPNRPFVVSAGDREVTAIGTEFLVRQDAERPLVAVMEGQVRVAWEARRSRSEIHKDYVVLSPGERLEFIGSAKTPRVDTPVLDRLTAWRQGQVDLTNLSLAEAVAEMNRYSSTVVLEVTGSDAPNIRVDGIFMAGDSRNFVKAIAQAYGVQVRETGNRIVISDPSP